MINRAKEQINKESRNRLSNIESDSRGFTLVEALVTIAIFTILMLGTTYMIRNILLRSQTGSTAIENIYQSRGVVFSFATEIRSAMYGADGAYPLAVVGDSEIAFYSGYATEGVTAQKIRYYVSGTKLYKGVTNPTGAPAIYDPSDEVVRVVQDNLDNASTPVFYYYTGDYAGSGSAMTQPVNINNVKYVGIMLIVRAGDDVQSTNSFTVNGGATIRNLKTNLGN